MRDDKPKFWIDHLFEKHECWDYDDYEKAALEVELNGRTVQVVMPAWCAQLKPLLLAESEGVLFILAQNRAPYVDDFTDGVLMVAKQLEPDGYAVGIWHGVYGYALNYFGLRERCES
ncbi:MAG: hypothetical protein NZM28_10345 [Fimbriimonadales bacterium]|nr:hypothetical protein [Fimbriimonadales bacterium]